MKRLAKAEGGFITLLITMVVLVVAAIVLVYLRVLKAQK